MSLIKPKLLTYVYVYHVFMLCGSYALPFLVGYTTFVRYYISHQWILRIKLKFPLDNFYTLNEYCAKLSNI